MGSASHTFFVDESGNAGINYLDDEQPFHVAAGILVENVDLASLRGAIKSACLPDEVEIKGARLLKRPDGQQRALCIIKAVAKAGAMPFFTSAAPSL